MKRYALPSLMLCVFLAAFIGCSTKTQRVDVDSESEIRGDTGTGSKDFRTACETMARSIIRLPMIQNAAYPPRIAILEVENNTREIMDTGMFTDKIQTLLIKYSEGKVMFLDRSVLEDILIERQAKRGGQLSYSEMKALSGADYFLTGKISSIDKADTATRETYTRFAFRLVDAESSAVVWIDEYEIKKVGTTGLWDR